MLFFAYDGWNRGGIDMGERELVQLRALTPAYAGRCGELTAVLQYVYQAVILDGRGREKEAKLLLKIAVDEMRHLQIIGGILVKRGIPPVFTACPPYPVAYYSAANVDYTRRFSEMISADIRAEKEAIAGYTRALKLLTDRAEAEAVAKIRADEERHLALLEELRAASEDRPQPPKGSRA